ncbi:MAG: ABC transporter ATP-binding protein [Deltaproteobacteria bacterium]|nr:MAG: ABC transporter ATP-binding protein [Deltaproteobacteria bacterium]
MSRMTNDLMSLRAMIGYVSLQIFNVSISIVLALSKMFAIDAWLTLACIVPLGGSLLVLRYALSRALRLMRRSQEELSELSEAILETYHGIPVIRGFGVEPAFLARLDRKNQAYVVTNLRLAKIRAFLIPIVGVAANFCVGGLLLWGGRGVIAGRMSVGDIAAYAAYLAMIATALTSLGWVINALQRGFLALVRIYEIFDTEPEVTPSDPEATARFLERAGGGIGIRVSHLSFSYPNQRGRRQALVDLSFEIAPGRVVGIFGMTGSGKSTLLRLLARIYDPPAGSIFLDGIDITRIDPGSLRRHLVVAPQVPFLFSQTIRENVAFGDPERKGEEGAIVAALSAAAFTEDLQALPEGLDTVVGERGVTLSGGQRQRIALARSFFRGGKLFLLDDVLSAVDQTTEERLIAEIYRQMGEDATLVITSHRLSVLQRADEILVLDQGRLIERGTHAQLVEKPGLYRDAWRYQQIVVEV